MDNIRSRIVDWWRGRTTVWKFILWTGTFVSVINGVIELYKNIWNEPISDVPVVFFGAKRKIVYVHLHLHLRLHLHLLLPPSTLSFELFGGFRGDGFPRLVIF